MHYSEYADSRPRRDWEKDKERDNSQPVFRDDGYDHDGFDPYSFYIKKNRKGRAEGSDSAKMVPQPNEPPSKRNKVLAGMSFRQQVKFLMQKTQGEANWDIENDSELKAASGKCPFCA